MLDFGKFYAAVHGYPPFRWQERLAGQIASEGWPTEGAITPPTASGKTSVIDVAVFALAVQAGKPLIKRTAPIRTFFVVDRRLVVDDVTAHSAHLRQALETSNEPEVEEVRRRLMSFGGGVPLEVVALRGGMYRSDVWADRPNQPLICVSTVDQVGSRLLFRGYGASERRCPVDAGLAGCDSLIILDEAHLSGPFLDTVRAVQRYSAGAEVKLAPVRLIQMSATAKGSGFALEAADYEADEKLAKRLRAEKMAMLREVPDLERVAAEEARRLASAPGRGVVGVVVNTVRAAREIWRLLDDGKDKAVLLTGRIRPYDRDRLIEKYGERFRAKRTRKDDDRLFVVATQTIEVGADLDFDALVTEAASLDALRQRFGRLDRIGELQMTEAAILKRKRKKGELDPVYGAAADETWAWLNEHASQEGVIDFGPLKVQELYEKFGKETLNAKGGEAPVLLPAHLETWVETYPRPVPDPDVAPFLHGADSASADVNLVWRGDLKDEPVERWVEILDLAPPLTTEALPIPIWTAKKWLAQQEPGDTTDVEGSAGEEEETGIQSSREFLIWRGKRDSRVGAVDQIRPGDTLVLQATGGGCDRFGWDPKSTDGVPDIADECCRRRVESAGGRYWFRVYPGMPDAPEKLAETLAGMREGDEDADAEIDALVRERFRDRWARRVPYGQKGVCYQWRWTKAPAKKLVRWGAEESAEDDGENDTASLTTEVTLEDHTRGVIRTVGRIANGIGLSADLTGALELAATLHDAGKADLRFQLLLGGPVGEKLLAKSGVGSSQTKLDRRRRIAGYPEGARHEFWSVVLASKCPELLLEHRDLILHLIGTHHGYGRPFAPQWNEEDIDVTADLPGARVQAVGGEVRALARLGSGWVDQFWRLNQRYGYWGLAYLEAVLRRGDCVQSREEQEEQ